MFNQAVFKAALEKGESMRRSRHQFLPRPFVTPLVFSVLTPIATFAINAKIDLAAEALIAGAPTTAALVALPDSQSERPATPLEVFVGQPSNIKLDIPYFFQVPRTAFEPLPEEVLRNKSPLLLVDQVNLRLAEGQTVTSATLPTLERRVGLRWLVVPQATDSAGRYRSATALGSSGMIQTGDVILSFRPEWYETLPYSHLQLGVSHAGLALLTRNTDGSSTLHNVDMPLDSETWGGVSGDHLAAKHYVEAPYLHIVRPIALHDGVNDAQEQKNVESWLTLIRKNASRFYKNPLTFNKNYMQANYTKQGDKADLTFVADLARLALGGSIKGQYGAKGYSMYCSEFAWTILSLRGCDPQTTSQAFLRGETPTCVSEIMPPLPVLGNYSSAVRTPQGLKTLDGSPLTIGLADGAMLIADTMTARQPDLSERNLLIQQTFLTADGDPTHISENHVLVQKEIMAKNPEFFTQLMAYFGLVGEVRQAMQKTVLGVVEKTKAQTMQMLQYGFNERLVYGADRKPVMMSPTQPALKDGSLNYSPTAYLVHALLPRGEKIKAFSYIATVAYVTSQDKERMEEALRDQMR